MHEYAGIAGVDSGADLGRRQGRGEAQVTAGQRLAETNDVRADRRMFAGE